VTDTSGNSMNVQNLTSKVKLEFKNPTTVPEEGQTGKCMAINESTGKLSSDGITSTYDATTKKTSCESTHLTSFVMVVDGTTTTTSGTVEDNDDDGLSAGAIAGIVIGAVAFLTGLILLTVFLVKKSRKNKMRR